MNKSELHQVRQDVERIRKAAARMDALEMHYQSISEKLEIATQGLKVIATWASTWASSEYDPPCLYKAAEELKKIESRAMDTLKLIGNE